MGNGYQGGHFYKVRLRVTSDYVHEVYALSEEEAKDQAERAFYDGKLELVPEEFLVDAIAVRRVTDDD